MFTYFEYWTLNIFYHYYFYVLSFILLLENGYYLWQHTLYFNMRFINHGRSLFMLLIRISSQGFFLVPSIMMGQLVKGNYRTNCVL